MTPEQQPTSQQEQKSVIPGEAQKESVIPSEARSAESRNPRISPEPLSKLAKRHYWRPLRRVLLTLPVLWVVVSIVFLLIHLVPGDPIVQMLGEGATASDIGALRHAYGLDTPLLQQYTHYWSGILHGNLGQSLRLHDSVTHLIVERYPYTLALTLAALVIGIAASIPAGVASALHRNRWQDRTLGVVSLLGLSFPNFALGPILILIFSISLGWLPVSTAGSGGVVDFLLHLILPALTLGLSFASVLTRMVRTSMLEELNQDYIRTARAKGLPERTVVYRHALRNALIPVLTVIGLQFGSLLAGAIVTETIFSWPGIGRLTISAIYNRDYALVQGCILAVGLTYVAVNLLTDVAYTVANPRMRSA
jgi:peptide/nickel transport system permease protein